MRTLTVTITYVLADSVSPQEAEEFKTSLTDGFTTLMETENMHNSAGDIVCAECEVALSESEAERPEKPAKCEKCGCTKFLFVANSEDEQGWLCEECGHIDIDQWPYEDEINPETLKKMPEGIRKALRRR